MRLSLQLCCLPRQKSGQLQGDSDVEEDQLVVYRHRQPGQQGACWQAATLLGVRDTSGHTGTAPDFIRLDGHGISSDVQAPDQTPADLKARTTLCTHKVDDQGKQQLDVCKDNELLILTGRAPGDTSGKVTSEKRGAGTLIDTHMASVWLASCAQQLEVLDMASRASWVCSDHLPLWVCFQLLDTDGEPPSAAPQQPSWVCLQLLDPNGEPMSAVQ